VKKIKSTEPGKSGRNKVKEHGTRGADEEKMGSKLPQSKLPVLVCQQ